MQTGFPAEVGILPGNGLQDLCESSLRLPELTPDNYQRRIEDRVRDPPLVPRCCTTLAKKSVVTARGTAVLQAESREA